MPDTVVARCFVLNFVKQILVLALFLKRQVHAILALGFPYIARLLSEHLAEFLDGLLSPARVRRSLMLSNVTDHAPARVQIVDIMSLFQ